MKTPVADLPPSPLSRFRQALVGWLYPPICASCEIPLDTPRQLLVPFLCEACEATLVPIGDHYCQVCGQGFDGVSALPFRCGNCGDRELAIDFAVSAYRGAGPGKGLVHRFKYGKERHLARLLGTLLDEVWRDPRLSEGGPWWVVPVPLHPRRERERGFNQSRELARELVHRAPSGLVKGPVDLLRRVRETGRQARLDRKERLGNLAGAFAARKRPLSLPQGDLRLLLVDDVLTTGATVSECAAILRGALEIDEIAAVSVLRG
ncbi:MAG: ComF family protein [Verrucomicrobiae bacterium]|nr:ComF family protein [Verrucomicrobiae bacterium]